MYKSGVQVYPSGLNVVYAFTACSSWDSEGDFWSCFSECKSICDFSPDAEESVTRQ